MEYLTHEEVYLLHKRLIQLIGHTSRPCDANLLASGVARPQASIDGKDLYSNPGVKAAARMQSLIKSIPSSTATSAGQ